MADVRGVAVVLLVLLTACGQDTGVRDPSTPPTHQVPLPTAAADPASLEGTWVGEWIGQDGSQGGFELTWTAQGDRLAGTLMMTGRQCLTESEATGMIQGQGVRFEATDGSEQAIFAGALAGAELSGSYSTTCPDGGGTWRTGRSGTRAGD